MAYQVETKKSKVRCTKASCTKSNDPYKTLTPDTASINVKLPSWRELHSISGYSFFVVKYMFLICLLLAYDFFWSVLQDKLQFNN